MSDPVSVRIVNILLYKDLKINQIQRITQEGRRTIDARLAKMRECNILTSEQDGRWLRWSLTDNGRAIARSLIEPHRESVEWDPQVTADMERLKREMNLPETARDN